MSANPTLATLAADLDAGRTTARKLVEECLARIADPAGEGARTFIHVDKDAAIAAADAMDHLRKANAAPSPYAGIPVSIKDLFDIKGQVTRAGSRALEEFRAGRGRCARGGAAAPGRLHRHRPHQHDRIRLFRHRHQSALRHAEKRLESQRRPCARRLVLGRGGLDRRSHGPWRARHRYRRLLPDSGGLNGIVGYKPTQRRVPLDGGVPLSSSLDSFGPLARTVGCCAVLDAVLADEAVQPLQPRPVKGMRLAVPTTIALDDLDDEVANDIRARAGECCRGRARRSSGSRCRNSTMSRS